MGRHNLATLRAARSRLDLTQHKVQIWNLQIWHEALKGWVARLTRPGTSSLHLVAFFYISRMSLVVASLVDDRRCHLAGKRDEHQHTLSGNSKKIRASGNPMVDPRASLLTANLRQ